MAVKTKSVVETRFRGVGADRLIKDMNSLNKSQTRLTHGSVSAGRQFSAQAAGLGGLVAVYAGAAATTFALQQAFSALEKSARSEQIIQGVNALAAAIGQSGIKITKAVNQIIEGQLSIVETSENVNIALAAGFNTDQIERLAGVANKASRALGRNLGDALERVFRGTAKLEPELLDELGIFTRIDPAVEAYASQMGKSVTALTDFERRQAFVNAAIEEGESKFESVDTSIKSANVTLQSFIANLKDMSLAVGRAVTRALSPLISILSNGLGLFSAFGITAGLVGSKFTEVAKNYGSIKSLEGKNAQFAAKQAEAIAAREAKAASGLENNTKNIHGNDFGSKKVNKDSIQEFRGRIVAGEKIKNKELQQGVRLLLAQKHSIKDTIRLRLKQVTANRTLLSIMRAEVDTLTAAEKKIRNQVIAQRLFNKEAKATNAILLAQKNLSLRNQVGRGVKRGIGAVAGAAGKAIGFASTALVGLSMAAMFVQVTASVLGLDDELNKAVKSIGTFILTLIKMNDEAKATRKAQAALKDIDTRFDAGFTSQARKGRKGVFTKEDLQKLFARGFASTQEIEIELRRQGRGNSNINTNRALAAELAAAFGLAATASKEAGGALAALAIATGQSTGTILKTFSIDTTGVSSIAPNRGLPGFTTKLSSIEDRPDMGTQATLTADAMDSGAIAAGLQNKLWNDLLDKNVKAENLTKAIGSIRSATAVVEKRFLITQEASLELQLKQLYAAQRILDKEAERQIAAEQLNSVLKDTFSSEFKVSEKLNGILGKNNKVAVNDAEVRENQLEILKDALDTIISQNMSIGLQGKLTIQQNTALKIGLGTLLKVTAALNKMNIALDTEILKSLKDIAKVEEAILVTSKQQAIVLAQQAKQQQMSILANEREHNKLLNDKLVITNNLGRSLREIDNQAVSELANGPLANFFTESNKRELTISFAKDDLQSLKNTLSELIIRNTQLAKEDTDNLITLIDHNRTILNAQTDLANQTYTSAVATINANKEVLRSQLAKTQIELDSLVTQASMYDNFLDRLAEILIRDSAQRRYETQAGFNQTLPEFSDQLIAEERARNEVEISLRENLEVAAAAASNAVAALTTNIDTLTKEQIKQAKNTRDNSIQTSTTASQQQLVDEINARANRTLQRENEVLAIESSIKVKQREIDKMIEAARISDNIYIKALGNVVVTMRDGFGKGLTDLNEAFVEGTLTMDNFKEGFKDFAIGMLKDIQKTVFQATIVDPVKDFVTEQTARLFGLDSLIKADGSTADKALWIRNADKAAAGLLAGDPTDLASKTEGLCKEVGKFTGEDGATGGFFEKVKDQFSKLGDGIMDIFSGVGDVLGDLFSGISTMFSGGGGGGGLGSLFSGFGGLFSGGASGAGSLGSLFGGGAMSSASSAAGFFGTSIGGLGAGLYLANGGTVPHMATGGKSLRDRHAAMLEPGEFVLRKHAAKSIGTNALNNMNALGASGMRGNNVSINVTNNGTAQETEGQPKIRFDGNQMVVDIILTDIRNNGPISQGMRGNA